MKPDPLILDILAIVPAEEAAILRVKLRIDSLKAEASRVASIHLIKKAREMALEAKYMHEIDKSLPEYEWLREEME